MIFSRKKPEPKPEFVRASAETIARIETQERLTEAYRGRLNASPEMDQILASIARLKRKQPIEILNRMIEHQERMIRHQERVLARFKKQRDEIET